MKPRWTSFERYWLSSQVSAMLPVTTADDTGLTMHKSAEFIPAFLEAAPPLLRLGLRTASWVFTFLPLFHWHYRGRFHRLSDEKRDRFITRMHDSPSYLLRQLAVTIKVTACFAVFSLRAQDGHEPL